MRLVKRSDSGEFSLINCADDKIPRYAILSHTWGADNDEVTFKDLAEGTGSDKPGYLKIRFCSEQAATDNIRHFWVDTCCIDKSSSAELTEAINSMFRWYSDATKCYVYLSDVSTLSEECTWEVAFRKSRWFTRGWTLQELIAPRSLTFFSSEAKRLGDKKSLEFEICDITGIAADALHRTCPISRFSIEERLTWAKHRETKRKEDKIYSLLGLFDIHMSLIYGEGEENAFNRFRKKLGKSLRRFFPSVDLLWPMRTGLGVWRSNDMS
jgi:hypothetical protein